MSEQKPRFTFPPQAANEWFETAKQELEGADPYEKLTKQTSGLDIKPYYDFDELQSREGRYALASQLAQNTTPRFWVNMPKVIVNNAKEANEKALMLLNSGAEGILFELPESDIAPEQLLQNIQLQYCTVSFLLESPANKFLQAFNAFITAKFNVADITGNFFFRNIPLSSVTSLLQFKARKNFQSVGIIAPDIAHPIEEIAEVLAAACQYADRSNSESDGVFNSFSVFINGGSNFFLEIARLKALRHLWYQVTQAYGLNPKPLYIHVNLAPFTKKEYQPNGNMIYQTTAALSAVLGGCNALTLEAEDHNNSMMARIAMNVSTILKEESHLTKVADPTAGSYYVESLTDQLAKKAWQKFQEITK